MRNALVRVRQGNRIDRQTDRTEIDVGYKELAHTITGAEKSHAPLSVSWHPRRAVVRVQSYLKV